MVYSVGVVVRSGAASGAPLDSDGAGCDATCGACAWTGAASTALAAQSATANVVEVTRRMVKIPSEPSGLCRCGRAGGRVTQPTNCRGKYQRADGLARATGFTPPRGRWWDQCGWRPHGRRSDGRVDQCLNPDADIVLLSLARHHPRDVHP